MNDATKSKWEVIKFTFMNGSPHRKRNLLSSKGLFVYRAFSSYGWRRQSEQHLGTLLEFNGMKCVTSCQLNKNLVLEKDNDVSVYKIETWY